MSPAVFPPIPPETARAARAVFGGSNFYLATGDQVDHLFTGLALDPSARAQPQGWPLAMLYLITVFQFMETLPDHLAAEALRKRVEWKYALHLPLSYVGLKEKSLCEFRRGLRVCPGQQQNMQVLLSRLSEGAGPDLNGSFSQDPRQVIGAVCLASRAARVWETISQALEALATRQPEWLLATSLPHWYERYGHGAHSLNLRAERGELEALAQATGADGAYLLKAIAEAGIPELNELSEVSTLEQVWREQYEYRAGVVAWRQEACAGCTQTI